MSLVNGKIEEMIEMYKELTSEEKDTLMYLLDRDYDLEDHLEPDTYQRRWIFKGTNYFDKEIINRIVYAYTEDEVVDCVKSLNYLFRTKTELEAVARGDDEQIETEALKPFILRQYSNCIVSYTIVEYDLED
jgi:hypothetical protein